MNRMITIALFSALVSWVVLSYGFIDPHLALSQSAWYREAISPVIHLVYRQSALAALAYAGIVILLFVWYRYAISNSGKISGILVAGVLTLMLLSYPALSYDIFNYIATAKVSFQYGENPYLVMPVEIANEPMLSYTRAANKHALYGPVWIGISSIPWKLGNGNITQTIFAFKGFTLMLALIFSWIVYSSSGKKEQVLLFLLNPLVLFEVVSSGHNDIAMMLLAVSGLYMYEGKGFLRRLAGVLLFVASVLVKGATIVLLPVFFMKNHSFADRMRFASIAMFGVFLLSPLREELYSWYAVWWLAIAACVGVKKYSLLSDFIYWMSFSLMMRYIPWIATREYGGTTPLIRFLITIIPMMYFAVKRRRDIYAMVKTSIRIWRKK